MEGTGVIEELTYKEGAKGSWFFKAKIDNRNYNCFEKDFNTKKEVEAYAQLKAKEVGTGDVVKFEYSEHKSGDTTYKNLLKIVALDEKQLGETSSGTPTGESYVPKKPYENKTGTQIVRMNALTNAIGFFELNKEVIAMNVKESDGLSAAVSEDLLLKLAEKFENWVKR